MSAGIIISYKSLLHNRNFFGDGVIIEVIIPISIGNLGLPLFQPFDLDFLVRVRHRYIPLECPSDGAHDFRVFYNIEIRYSYVGNMPIKVIYQVGFDEIEFCLTNTYLTNT